MRLKKALILTWTGFQDQEVIYPYYRLQEDGFTVHIVSDKRQSPVEGLFGTKFFSDFDTGDLISVVHVEDYDLLVLPGGVKALEKLRQEERALDFVMAWNARGQLIASICHGAQILISAMACRGRNISGYYSIKDDITNAGATFCDLPYVEDDNIVSSPHYKHMGPWMGAVLRCYNARNSA